MRRYGVSLLLFLFGMSLSACQPGVLPGGWPKKLDGHATWYGKAVAYRVDAQVHLQHQGARYEGVWQLQEIYPYDKPPKVERHPLSLTEGQLKPFLTSIRQATWQISSKPQERIVHQQSFPNVTWDIQFSPEQTVTLKSTSNTPHATPWNLTIADKRWVTEDERIDGPSRQLLYEERDPYDD